MGSGCDTAMPLATCAARELAGTAVVQGNLDPLLLVTGGPALDAGRRNSERAVAAQPFIFNLGHGIVPETPPENVARLVELVRRAPNR